MPGIPMRLDGDGTPEPGYWPEGPVATTLGSERGLDDTVTGETIRRADIFPLGRGRARQSRGGADLAVERTGMRQ
jgi:hypothetical protein